MWRWTSSAGKGCCEGEELAVPRRPSPRGRRGSRRCPTSSTRACATLGVRPAVHAPARGLGRRARAASTCSSRPAPPPGRRSRSTCPSSTRSRGEPKSRALYLYPTKALAQDQFRTLSAYGVPRLKPAIYDGDTPTEQRWQIRKWANVILTNPDMVHVGVLPNHDRWGDVLANLRYVVVDEAHVYRGVFGSHVANVLRRLRRLARIYGSEPQFLLASATISNPGELGASLLGERGDRDRRRRGAARRADDRALEPAAARRGARPARVGARGGGEAAGDVRRARPADAHVREEPEGGGADPPLHRRAARRRHAPLAVSRRLHRAAAPRDRAAARRKATCSASRRRTRSSSGSTSACSTP